MAGAQSNSPLSRFGLGDQSAPTNVLNRGMGGVAAASNDYFSINYNNPASYAFFNSVPEYKSRKLAYGRAVLNVAISNEGRSIIDLDKKKFNSNNIIFSNIALGVPLRKNWGMAFGMRPLNRIDYKLVSYDKVNNPTTGSPIENAQTFYEGTGGAYLASLGTGVKIKTGKFSFLGIGVNGGYMFGKKEYTSRRSMFNDTTQFENGFQQTSTGIGGLYFDAGLQYQFKLTEKLFLGLGAFGNWEQKIKTSRDIIAGTYTYDVNTGYVIGDTAYISKNIAGNLNYPSTVTAGFILQKPQGITGNEAGWLIGVDLTRTNWDNYRFYGKPDSSVKTNFQAKFGAELRPARKENYFSNVAYRFGFFTGPDYIFPKKSLPSYGLSLGLGLPLANYNQQAKGQISLINLAFEYIKRGNNSSLLKENMYRISVGFSLTDQWFGKRRYMD